jgi:predicted anti-sigma-YlaC factor YlaD
MTHEEARLLLGAVPGEVSPVLAEHLAKCPACTQFQEQMQRLDRDLTRVFNTPLPPRAETRVLALPRMTRARPTPAAGFPGFLALAASVVLSVGLGVMFWTLRPEPSLAAGVLGHIAQESDSWSQVAPMTAAATDQVLAGAGVTLDPTDTTVTYARICLFNGRWVPHLVVRTARGPVTLMVLRQEHIRSVQSFRQNGYTGELVPDPAGGTLAVIAQGQPNMDDVMRAISPHLHWNP